MCVCMESLDKSLTGKKKLNKTEEQKPQVVTWADQTGMTVCM